MAPVSTSVRSSNFELRGSGCVFAQSAGPVVLAAAALLVSACAPAPSAVSTPRAISSPQASDAAFAAAAENGRAANEAFVRSRRLMVDWLAFADPASGLLPRYLEGESRDIWNAQDTAADLYPFLVLTAFFTDPALYHGRMIDILLTETALTSRLDRLPDTYAFSKRGFAFEDRDLTRILFGASEYIKDGLLPITEFLGDTPWRVRMLGMLNDIWRHAPIETPRGRIPSDNPEVNGNMLQALSRAYWMTRDARYLEYATRLGDYYLVDGHHPTRHFETLRLRDHGNEIVSGLTEFYATISKVDPPRAAQYREPMHTMLDRILEVGRNTDGLFYNVIDPRGGKPVNDGIADNFGYILNGFYTVYLLDGTEAYRDAVRRALASLNTGYRGFNWENLGQDGDADAVEGALNLYNREPVPSAAEWIDFQTRWMWSKQDSAHRPNMERWRGSGIVEGGYADGNFSRTSIMYALWKTGGTSVQPWRPDVVFGAVRDGDALHISLRADSAWAGTVRFDGPRHRTNMGMPMDWPRMNQFPEWFTVQADHRYEIHDVVRTTRATHTGTTLQRGLPLELAAGRDTRLVVRPWKE
jgi:hypothetical protein